MTVFGEDRSDFDAPRGYSGLGFLTHKATEGTDILHIRLPIVLGEARTAGVPVLGAYHVVRTPGNGGQGSIAAQLNYYLGVLDAKVPWWRTHPYWMHQVDLELWAYDQVSAATGRAFVTALQAADPGRFVITYASRGQYGNQLAGWPGALWNADYRQSSSGLYPGDGWTVSGSAPAGWAPYSGQTPVLLQYTSTPYDRDAFRGSIDQLQALVSGGEDMTNDEHNLLHVAAWGAQRTWEDADPIVIPPNPATGYLGYTGPNLAKQARDELAKTGAPTDAQVTQAVEAALPAALLAALRDPQVQAGIAHAITHQ